MEISVIVLVVIVTALAFDFTNGFHDTANAVATSIATGALKPRTAVLIAGVLNLVGAFLSVQVAKTISSGLARGGARRNPRRWMSGGVWVCTGSDRRSHDLTEFSAPTQDQAQTGSARHRPPVRECRTADVSMGGEAAARRRPFRTPIHADRGGSKRMLGVDD